MQADDRPPNPLTVLVVDDDLDTREFIVELLSFAGYHTLEAAFGAAALDVLAGQAVQGIVLDLRLPDMDGLAVCRQIRATGRRDLPIILVTADQTLDVKRRADEAGVTTLLAKPFDPEELLERLETVLQA